MAGVQLTLVLRHIRKLAGDRKATDRQLLHRYAARRGEAAFELLVERHGPAVLGLCRRVLPREQDAEDVFQATFLIFGPQGILDSQARITRPLAVWGGGDVSSLNRCAGGEQMGPTAWSGWGSAVAGLGPATMSFARGFLVPSLRSGGSGNAG
jgi:hypothetical protein